MRVDYSRTESYQAPVLGMGEGPYLSVRIQHGGLKFDTFGLVDSGADYSVFNKEIADYFGFDTNRHPDGSLRGIGGSPPFWKFDVVVKILGRAIPMEMAFSPGAPQEFGLLGRADFFDVFRVGFSQRDRQVLLHPLQLLTLAP
jgi:hypothetical protein